MPRSSGTLIAARNDGQSEPTRSRSTPTSCRLPAMRLGDLRRLRLLQRSARRVHEAQRRRRRAAFEQQLPARAGS